MFSLFIKFLSYCLKKEQLNKLLLSTNSKGEDFYSYYKKFLKMIKKINGIILIKSCVIFRKNKINLNNIINLNEPGYLSILLKKYQKN